MGAQLVTKVMDQAMSMKKRTKPHLSGLGVIVHSDAGSQYSALPFPQKLPDSGMLGTIGAVATAYDNALLESAIAL